MTGSHLHILALLLYAGAAVLYGAHLALKQPRQLVMARAALACAVLAHTAAIGFVCVSTHQSPFASSHGTLSAAAWVIALAFLPVDISRRLSALGALALPVVCVLLSLSMFRQYAVPSDLPMLRSGVIVIHIFLVLMSFALFVLAACCAAFYVWQYKVLKHPGRRAAFRRLPPLETVDVMAFRLVAFALPLLTVGLALGIVRAAGGGLKGNWLLDPHFIGSVVAWLVYGAYLGARTMVGWRGTRLNYLLLAGLVITMALFFVPSTAHRFT